MTSAAVLTAFHHALPIASSLPLCAICLLLTKPRLPRVLIYSRKENSALKYVNEALTEEARHYKQILHQHVDQQNQQLQGPLTPTLAFSH